MFQKLESTTQKLEHTTVQVVFNKPGKNYLRGDKVAGEIRLGTHHQSMAFKSIIVRAQGSTKVQLNAQSVGLFEAFYASIKPLVLWETKINLQGSGRVSRGWTSFPFEFVVDELQNDLFETYHGLYITTSYRVRATLSRGVVKNSVSGENEFFLELPPQFPKEFPKELQNPLAFDFSPDRLTNLHRISRGKDLPKFHISGLIHSPVCSLADVFTGSITVHKAEQEIREIEVHLIRVETIVYSEGVVTEASEVQKVQIVAGDPCRGLQIPISLRLPKYFTCPTMVTDGFKVGFEMKLWVCFTDDYVLTESFPVFFYRGKKG